MADGPTARPDPCPRPHFPAAGRGGVGWLLTAAGAAVLVLGLADLYRVLHDGRSGLTFLVNGDTLFPDRLYADVFRDGFSPRGWQFSASLYLFPDFTLYAGLRAALGRPLPAVVAYAAAQYALLLAAYAGLAAAVAPAGRRWVGAVLTACLGAGFAAVCSVERLTNLLHTQLFMTQLHVGALIASAAGLGLLAVALTGPFAGRRHGPALLGVFAVTAAATASDKLVIPWFVVPAAAATAAAWVCGLRSHDRGFARTRNAAAAVGVLVAAAAAGVAAQDRLHTGRFHPGIDGIGDAAGLRPFTDGLAKLGQNLRAEAGAGEPIVLAAALVLGAAAVWFGRGLVRAARDPHPPAVGPATWLAGYYLAMVVTTAVPVVASGLTLWTSWPINSKYTLPVWYHALFGTAVVAQLAAGSGVSTRRLAAGCGVAVAAAAVAVGYARVQPAGRDQSVSHYYPEEARVLDTLARKYGLRYGLGGFWEAHALTAYSRAGVRVYPVEKHDGNPWGFTAQHWLSNLDWFAGAPGSAHPDPRYTFLVVGPDLRDCRPRVEAAFGPPVEAVTAGDATILVYARPGCDLTDAIRYDAPLVGVRFRFGGGERATYPARALIGHGLGEGLPDGSRLAAAGSAPGVLFSGPWLTLRPGRYRVTVRASSAAAGLVVFGYAVHNPVTKSDSIGGAVPIPAGDGTATRVEFTVPDDPPGGHVFATHAAYQGGGRFVAHGIDLERVP